MRIKRSERRKEEVGVEWGDEDIADIARRRAEKKEECSRSEGNEWNGTRKE